MTTRLGIAEFELLGITLRKGCIDWVCGGVEYQENKRNNVLLSRKTLQVSCKRKFPSNHPCTITQKNWKCQSCTHWLKNFREKACVKIHIMLNAITNI